MALFHNPNYQRVRLGKTQREHRNGNHSNRFANRSARQDWQFTHYTSVIASQKGFPRHACNGKRNRSVVTLGGMSCVIDVRGKVVARNPL